MNGTTPILMRHRSLMKHAATALAILYSCTTVAPALAANRFWVGGSNTVWEKPTNWSSNPGGGGTQAVPTSSDIAIFHASSGHIIQIRSAVNVQGISILSTFTGSILQGSGAITVGSNGVRMGSGTFVGGSSGITLRTAGWTQTGGIVRGIQGNGAYAMVMSGSLSVRQVVSTNSPSFTSTGTIVFADRTSQRIITPPTNAVKFRNITLRQKGGGDVDSIIFSGGTLNMSGALTITSGNLDMNASSGVLIVRGGITFADDAQATLETRATMTVSGSIVMGDAASLTMTGGALRLNGNRQDVDLNDSSLISIIIGSGTYLRDNFTVSTSITINAGATLTNVGRIIGATGATIVNNGYLVQGTGALVHRPTSILVADSSYAEIGEIKTGATAYFTLTDSDENENANAADTLTVTISTGAGDSESLTLTETGNATGIFRGTIATENATGVASDSKIGTATDTLLTMSFTDGQDALVNGDNTTLSVATTTSTTTAASGGGGGGGGGGGRKAVPSSAASTKAKTPAEKRKEGRDGGNVDMKKLTPAQRRELRLQKRIEANKRRDARKEERMKRRGLEG